MRERIAMRPGRAVSARQRARAGGWTLFELVITVTILSILTLGVMPLVKTSVRRQREQQLREVLRDMREAIKEFRRDATGMPCAAGATAAPPSSGQGQQGQGQGQPGVGAFVDPR